MHDPSHRTMGPVIAAGYRVYDLCGIGFTHPLGDRTSVVGISDLIPVWAIVWAPLHCFAATLEKIIKRSFAILDRVMPGRSAVWAIAFEQVAGLRRVDTGTQLSFGMLRRIYDRRDLLPSTGHDPLDRHFSLFFKLFGAWNYAPRYEQREDMRHAHRYVRVARRFRASHRHLFPTSMTPKEHQVIDHFGPQWLVSGMPDFPFLASDEPCEKGHRVAKRAWRRSIMTTVAPDGSSGLDEIFRTHGTELIIPWFVPSGQMTTQMIIARIRYLATGRLPPAD